jgi:hypothetical protein
MVLGVVAAIVVAAMTATAGGAVSSGRFTCRASALHFGNFEPYRANAKNDPCVADEEGMSGRRYVPSGLSVEGIVSARTERRDGAPTNRAVSAHSEVSQAEWRRTGTTPLITVKGATSYARDDCASGSPVISTESHIDGLTINGKTLSGGSKPQTYQLGFGTLYLNRTIQQDNAVIVRAVELDMASSSQPDLVLAESRVGHIGDPCL